MITKEYNLIKEGKYIQRLKIKEDNGMKFIDDATCTCIWGSIHIENYQKAEKICRHLAEFINEQTKEIKND